MKSNQSSTQSTTVSKSQPVSNPPNKVQSLEILYLQTPNLKSEQLFDYNEQHPKMKKVILKDSAVFALSKEGKFCFLHNQFQKDQKLMKRLLEQVSAIFCSLTLCQDYYLLKPVNHQLSKPVWINIDSFPSQLFPIKIYDTIRLGSKVLTVKQLAPHDYKNVLSFQEQQQLLQKLLQTNDQLQIPSIIKSPNDQSHCKVCKKKGEIKNPLLLPCKCTQSSAFVHFKCLRKLFNENYKIKTNHFSFTVQSSPLKCLKCKGKLQNKYKIKQKIIKVFSLPRPRPPYMIFEHQSENNQKKKQHLLEIVPFVKNKSLCLGKSQQSHIRFQNQEPLENAHCQIVYNEEAKKFLLLDLESRFGTLLNVRKSVRILPHHENIQIQIGNAVLDLTAKRPKVQQKNNQSHKIFENDEIINQFQKQELQLFL